MILFGEKFCSHIIQYFDGEENKKFWEELIP
jgi:hypothetical protein